MVNHVLIRFSHESSRATIRNKCKPSYWDSLGVLTGKWLVNDDEPNKMAQCHPSIRFPQKSRYRATQSGGQPTTFQTHGARPCQRDGDMTYWGSIYNVGKCWEMLGTCWDSSDYSRNGGWKKSWENVSKFERLVQTTYGKSWFTKNIRIQRVNIKWWDHIGKQLGKLITMICVTMTGRKENLRKDWENSPCWIDWSHETNIKQHPINGPK